MTPSADEVERSQAIAAAADLDEVANDPEGEGRTMRWILLHMIEEIARHLATRTSSARTWTALRAIRRGPFEDALPRAAAGATLPA
ncbi:MAG: mycothiol transferase [Actinomycetota bacterium]